MWSPSGHQIGGTAVSGHQIAGTKPFSACKGSLEPPEHVEHEKRKADFKISLREEVALVQCTSYWNPIQTFKFQACPPRPGRRLRRPAYTRQTHKHSTCCSRAGVCWFSRAASQQVLECGVVVECGHSLASEPHGCNPLRGYIVLLLATAPLGSAVCGAITMSSGTRA